MYYERVTINPTPEEVRAPSCSDICGEKIPEVHKENLSE
jgi:hypothetical protein